MAMEPQLVPVKPSDMPPVLIPGELVPPAVREGASLADRLQAEHIARMNGTLPPEPTPEPAPVIVEPAPTPPGNNPDPELILPAPAPPGTDEAKWEHAYKSAKGRFDAGIARMQTIVDGQAAEIRRLNTLPPPVAQPAAPVLAPTAPLDLVAAGVSEEEISTWGPEIFAAMDKIIAQRTAGMAAELRAEIAPKIDGVAQTVQADSEARMGSMLNQQLAAYTGGKVDFNQINTDTNFIAWLDLPDTMSGVRRQDLLETAWNSRDGSRVLAICKAYLGDSATPAPTPAANPTPAPATPQAAPKVPLASLAAPGRARAPAPSQGPVNDKPTYTRDEVKKFYAAKHKGFYTPEDALKWETEIIAASNEGRIVN